jgi:hypothetical protein
MTDRLRKALLRIYDLAENRPDIRQEARAALDATPPAVDQTNPRSRWHQEETEFGRRSWACIPITDALLAYIDGLAEALRAYIDHDLGGVHVTPGEEVADYEACETLHYRFGALAYPDKASEYGRLLAERDRLIGQGVDPADLDAPLPPGK